MLLIGLRYTLIPYYLYRSTRQYKYLVFVMLRPSCLAFCGHNPSLRIAIVFSPLSSVPKLHCATFVFLSSSFNTCRSALCNSRLLPLCEFYALLLGHMGTSLLLLSPPPQYWCISSFWQVQVPYTKSGGGVDAPCVFAYLGVGGAVGRTVAECLDPLYYLTNVAHPIFQNTE